MVTKRRIILKFIRSQCKQKNMGRTDIDIPLIWIFKQRMKVRRQRYGTVKFGMIRGNTKYEPMMNLPKKTNKNYGNQICKRQKFIN